MEPKAPETLVSRSVVSEKFPESPLLRAFILGPRAGQMQRTKCDTQSTPLCLPNRLRANRSDLRCLSSRPRNLPRVHIRASPEPQKTWRGSMWLLLPYPDIDSKQLATSLQGPGKARIPCCISADEPRPRVIPCIPCWAHLYHLAKAKKLQAQNASDCKSTLRES